MAEKLDTDDFESRASASSATPAITYEEHCDKNACFCITAITASITAPF
jgi:hypothetical protein